MIVRKSRAIWLTKAVDTAVSLPAHVVVYMVPACPADTWAKPLTRKAQLLICFILDREWVMYPAGG